MNFQRLVLGCIDADFFASKIKTLENTRWKALEEIYKIYILYHIIAPLRLQPSSKKCPIVFLTLDGLKGESVS